jgi:hypothetical protein
VVDTRVLVSFEPEYRAYESAIAKAIRRHRPYAQVSTAGPGGFEAEVARVDPHLVISGRLDAEPPSVGPAWVRFHALEPEAIVGLCLDGEYSEANNPGLGELLSIVDETERLSREKLRLGGC